MQLIDTHAHLFWDKFDDDFEQVIERAKEKGISKIFNPNVDSTTIDKLLEISKNYPENIFPLMGLHPGSVKEDFEKELEIIEKHLRNGKFYGVGEIGIDLYWEENKKFLPQQTEAFIYQIKLAKELKLPIVIHTRKSFNEIFNVIDKENDDNLFGIFHCFSGNINQAEKILEYGGFKLGLGGVLTYENTKLPKVISKIGIEHLVLETDAPFLPPVPKRGERNEISFMYYVAEKLAEIKNISVETVAEETTKNATEIFGNMF
ncbi:MAG: TatD family hydrolase [Bacteroidales bacterium]|nr:TatD family hydrolase [Bacteroidales bacterium]